MLQHLIGFVPQDDTLHQDMTAKENLQYCCQLRADPSRTRDDQRRLVDQVISSLDLTKKRHKLVGSTEKRGLSGGERKRVNVGMELMGEPLLLFLDEPTSGLDSCLAEELMSFLHELSAKGLTIAAVVHQPRVEVFKRLDDVLFLGTQKVGEDEEEVVGRVAYYGPGKVSQSVSRSITFKGAGISTNVLKAKSE